MSDTLTDVTSTRIRSSRAASCPRNSRFGSSSQIEDGPSFARGRHEDASGSRIGLASSRRRTQKVVSADACDNKPTVTGSRTISGRAQGIIDPSQQVSDAAAFNGAGLLVPGSTRVQVSNDEYPVYLNACSATSARMLKNVRPTVSFRTGGVGFATLCDNSAGNAAVSMFSPLFDPVAVNLLAVLLLSHMVFANLIYCTQHFGNSSSRGEPYQKEALMAFYFSVLGYDLTKINTSLGRLLAGIDTLLQSVLMTLFVSAVTVVSITASDSQFDPDSLTDYTIASVPNSATYAWAVSTGAHVVDMSADYSDALTLLESGEADAILSVKEPLNQVIKEHPGVICSVDGEWNINPKVIYINSSYGEYGDDFNVALQELIESGEVDALATTWLDSTEDAWGGWGKMETALWAILALLAVGLWLGILTVSKFRSTLVKRRQRQMGDMGKMARGEGAGNPRLAV
ncbi:hypothetical protein KIPB_003325 [Kipferlia bialata]|uniref:Solute-binding protein family 3/N-terminal domain-containing protein n=1 Tax=Kipferlia bialata TaxID=797122 RepID=A0A9K3GHC5_9EUKA|nr:hypothetical protein KIPB_003325 [Kipferlia bialata]|eukprot:g3325.t1